MHTLLRRTTAALIALMLLTACEGAAPSPTPTAPSAAPTATVAAPTEAATGAPTTAPTAVPAAQATARPTRAASGKVQPGPGDGKVEIAKLYHMSRDSYYRAPGGAVPAGTVVTLRLKSAPGDLTGAAVRVWDSRANREHTLVMGLETRAADADIWKLTLQTPATPDILWYRFVAKDGSATGVFQDDAARDGGAGEGRDGANDYDYSINCYDPKWTLPAGVQDAVIYHIFPDRFNNGDPANDRPAGQPVYDTTTTRAAWADPPKGNVAFYGGDLQGVIAKLDYLQSLGVNTIYFNPIFDAGSNHGYDTRDYTKVADWFGGQAAFDQLLAETQKRGMHVLLDGVFNHSGSDSLYFDRYSRYPTEGAFESKDSPYFGWYRFPRWPKWYNTFENYDSLPAFQEADPVRDFLFRTPDSIAQRWLKTGVAGWRLDAPKYKTEQFWRDFRTSVRAAYPDAVIIGEYWENAAPWLSGDSWDGTTNYRFLNAAWGFFGSENRLSADALDAQLASVREDYPPNALLASMNIIATHDKERPLHVAGGDKDRLRLMALLQFTSLGAPTIYYGDEAGLTGGADPDNRRAYPWGQEDADLIAFYRLLGQTRQAVPALRTGATTTLLTHNADRLYAYARHTDASLALVAFNAGTAERTLDLDVSNLAPDGTVLKDVLADGTAYTVQGGHVQVTVAADGGALLTK